MMERNELEGSLLAEISRRTKEISETQHELARQITDVLWKAAESGFSGPAFIFSIRDVNSAHQDDEQDNFGALLTSDWQPKLAASVLAR